ncbi:MAG: alpha/beta hydrolase [Deltaproteobacteria bacterium]|nr:MAG: alpha/beta hydrolase [Deltaproteobacteria bacterium]
MEFLETGPRDARETVVLAPGAGAPMDSAFMNAVAEGLADAGLRVVRFEFPYMQRRRETGDRQPPDREPVLRKTWCEVVERLGGGPGLVLGGKSLGGRIASLVADEVRARGLLCFGYPFHPAGQPDKLRIAHLAELRTRALIVQGERDPLGDPDEVAKYKLSNKIRIVWMEDGDHSLKPRKRSGRTEEQNLREAVEAAAAFVASLAGTAVVRRRPART